MAYSFVSLESLIDIVTGEVTATTTTTVSDDNKISVAVNISAEEGNAVVSKTDGIYVPKVTLAYATESDIDALFTT